MKSLVILILFIGLAAAQKQLGNSFRGNPRRYKDLSQSSVSKSSSSESRESGRNNKPLASESSFFLPFMPVLITTGGSEATTNQFPYQVFLLLETSRGQKGCSGSIISENYVLTAAHCVNELLRGDLWAGILNFMDNVVHEFSFIPADVTVHPDYNKFSHVNDIALISAKKSPFTFDDPAVQSIALAPRSYASTVAVGQMTTIAGWGLNENREQSNALKYIETPILEDSECKSKFPQYNSSIMICVSGADNKATCVGDSGGASTTEDGDSRVLLGIVSLTMGSCKLGFPTVMTRVPAYYDWITSVTEMTIN